MADSPGATDRWLARPETDLIAALRRGENSAFESLIRSHGPRLLAVIRRILREESDAADALQEAFITAFRRIDQFDGRSQLGTWLHRVAVNAALMRLRKKKRLAEQSIDELQPQFDWTGHAKKKGVAWRDTPDEQVERDESRQIVLDMIAQLPDTHREVLLMRDIQELSTEETAAALDINVGAVKTRLHRARLALRTLLEPHMQEMRK